MVGWLLRSALPPFVRRAPARSLLPHLVFRPSAWMGCAAKASRMDALRWPELFYLLALPALGRHAARNTRPDTCRPFKFLRLTDSCETLEPSACTRLAEKPPP